MTQVIQVSCFFSPKPAMGRSRRRAPSARPDPCRSLHWAKGGVEISKRRNGKPPWEMERRGSLFNGMRVEPIAVQGFPMDGNKDCKHFKLGALDEFGGHFRKRSSRTMAKRHRCLTVTKVYIQSRIWRGSLRHFSTFVSGPPMAEGFYFPLAAINRTDCPNVVP